MTYFVMAMALVLGFTQCKKEQPTPQSQGVRITLNVNGGASTVSAAGGSKVIVNPNAPEGYATVTFEENDVIYVGNNGHYCGYLEYDGTNFTGTISDDNLSADDYLHFYFMGNKGEKSQPSSVNISDQTEKYPVISYAHSNEFYGSTESYTANLQNYCAIVKFTTTDIDADITIKGMKNTVAVDFSVNNAASSVGINHNPYTTSMTGEGDIILHAESNTVRWAILLPQDEVTTATATAPFYDTETPFTVPKIEANTYYTNSGAGYSVTLSPAGSIVNLSDLSGTGEYVAQDGDILTGTLASGVKYKISIADGATVTLDGVNITNLGKNCNWAGINCPGDATIILKDGSTNTVCAGRDSDDFNNYPGIWIAPDKKLTIKGGGKLTAYSNDTNPYGAGIGGGYGYGKSCGNIEIQGGDITATGGGSAAGIGSGQGGICGTITISGGTVTATGGDLAAGIGSGYGNNTSCVAITITGGTVTATGDYGAAGIGSGYYASCGAITITTDVTQVTATKGGESAPNSIGAGVGGSCGTVTIGGVVYYENNAYVGTGSTYLTQDQIVYPQP